MTITSILFLCLLVACFQVVPINALTEELLETRAVRFEDNDFGGYLNTLDISLLIASANTLVFKTNIAGEFMSLNSGNYGVFTSSPGSAQWFRHYYYGSAHYYQVVGGAQDGYWLSYSNNGYLGAYSWINTRAFSDYGCLSVTGETWKTYKYNTGGVNYVVIGSYTYPLVCFQTVEYDYFSIESKYVGESKSCVWQNSACPGQCAPYVTYYSDYQSQALRVTVSGGKLYQNGALFDTSNADLAHSGTKAIAVMDRYGNLFASNQFKKCMFHHSTILAAADVTFAGEMSVINGVIQQVTTCSGHYKTPITVVDSLKISLSRMGYYSSFGVIDCSSTALNDIQFIWDLDFNCVHESCKVNENLLRDLDYNIISKSGYKEEL